MESRIFDRTTPPHIVTLVLVAALSSMTMNVFLPSLPAMAEHFGTSHAVMQYAISGYLFVCGIVQLAIGPLADRFGRRPVLLATIALFAAASLGATVAPNVETFMFCRVVQTAMVSGFVLSRTIARDMVGPTRAASLIGYVTMGMALVPTGALLLGGVLQELFGWTANFLLQAAVAFAALLMVFFDLGETSRNRPSGFSEQVRQFPELFRSRRFWGYSITCAFSTGTFFAYLGGGPFIAAQVYGLEPGQIGLYFTFAPLGYLVGNGISGKFSIRFGRQRMVVAGTIVIAVGMAAALAVPVPGRDPSAVVFRVHGVHRSRQRAGASQRQRRNAGGPSRTRRRRVRTRRIADHARRRRACHRHREPPRVREQHDDPAPLHPRARNLRSCIRDLDGQDRTPHAKRLNRTLIIP